MFISSQHLYINDNTTTNVSVVFLGYVGYYLAIPAYISQAFHTLSFLRASDIKINLRRRNQNVYEKKSTQVMVSEND